jgi:hypothetical protein
LVVFAAGTARAQQGTLHGTVVDSSGAPIPDAEVTIASLVRVTRTDSLGRLVFVGLARGSVEVASRHLGYRAQSQQVEITGRPFDSVTFILAEQPVPLSEVDVSATSANPFFRGFESRRERGIGTFVTREQIDAQHTSTASDLFRTIPQVKLVRAGTGLGVRFPSNMSLRGRGSNMCAPMIWLDGQRVPGMEIDDLRATDIEGIEIYRGAATMPAQFATPGLVQCGAIVVWTRRRA